MIIFNIKNNLICIKILKKLKKNVKNKFNEIFFYFIY